jgi:hypothetical protein
MAESKSTFATLSAISVKDKIERKGNLDYLSWANAWSLLKTHYPNAQRRIYEHAHTGLNYFTDGKSAYVKVGIEVNGTEHIDYLPVMDYKNNAIKLDNITATDVNKTIQRSTAKAIAMHGLGLSLWTGEDVPEMTTESPAKAKAVSSKTPTKTDEPQLIELVMGDDNWKKVATYIKENASKGVEAIGKQLVRKYKISKELRKDIANMINEINEPENN